MTDHAIIARDLDGLIIGWNSGAERLLGYSAPEIVGKPIETVIPPADLAEVQVLVRRLQRKEAIWPLRIRHVTKTGESRILTVVVVVTRDPDGEFAMITHLAAAADDSHYQLLARWISVGHAQSVDDDGREYMFRQLLNEFPQMIWRSTPDGQVNLLSAHWQEFTGRRQNELLGDAWLDCLHPDDRQPFIDRWCKARAADGSLTDEVRLRRSDGQYCWMEVVSWPIRNREGAILCWMGAWTNVHEMRETQRALLEERQRFARVVASAPGAIYEFRRSPDGHVTFPFVSAGMKEFYPVDPAELAKDALAILSFIHPSDVEAMTHAMLESAEQLAPFRCEWRINHPDKGELWVEARSVPVRKPDGSTAWYGIILDISERKHSEELLHVSQAQLQAVVSAGGIGTWVRDVQNDTLWWDEKMLKIWGRNAAEVNGRSARMVLDFIHPEDRPAIASSQQNMGQGKETTINEFRVQRGDGSWAWVAVNGVVELGGDGKPVRMIGACTDITERKREEETQRRSQRLEALGTLAGGIAHDFNNILLAITGNTRLAMSDVAADHPLQVCLREIDKASGRATNLVQRILAFSRQTEPKREVIHLQPTVEEALRLLRSTLPAMIQIQTTFAPDIPAISADSTQIHQVVMNLLTNSAHAIGEGPGVVSVSIDSLALPGDVAMQSVTMLPGRYVRLTVSDTGAGMSSVTQERIFDPFFTTKPAGQGTGLGLSVVHGIVRGHRGAITVDSAPGQGATFRLYFPAVGSDEIAHPEEQQEPAYGRGQRVMYVDDEDALVYLVTRKLERLGYAVVGFTDPAAALNAFQAAPESFDVVVSDMSMPGMSGFHLAKAILDTRPAVPVLMTSGYVRTQDREAALQLGVRDLIMKPNTIDELGQVLAELFEATPRPAHASN